MTTDEIRAMLAKITELWNDSVPIVGFSRYRVHQSGLVVSSVPWRGCALRILDAAPNSHGYLRVRVVGDDESRKSLFVHKLVADGYLPTRPSRAHELCHLNGIRSDNRVENLRWGTRKENAADRTAHGMTAKGVRHGMSKLTPEAVREIRANKTESLRGLARRLGVSDMAVRLVRKGDTWRHIR